MSGYDSKIPPNPVSNQDIVDELTKDLRSVSVDEQNTEFFEVNPEDREDDALKRAGAEKESSFKNIGDVDEHFAKEEDAQESDSDSDGPDDETLTALEAQLSEEERLKRETEAESLKAQGNDAFKVQEYEKSVELYTQAISICPHSRRQNRSILYSNRAAAKMKLDKNKSAIKDCTKAISYDDKYIKAYYRRAQCHELCKNLDESLADYQKIVELDGSHVEAQRSIRRLPPLIQERNENLKTEMLTNLKSLGNMILKPFGLSTANFQMQQDPDTKGYSINFKQ